MSEMEILALDPQVAVIRLQGRLFFLCPIVMPGETEPLSVRFIRDDGETVYVIPGQIPKPKKPCRLCPAKEKRCLHAAAVVELGLMRAKP